MSTHIGQGIELDSSKPALFERQALFMVTVFMGSNIVTNSLSAIVVLAEMDEVPYQIVEFLELAPTTWLLSGWPVGWLNTTDTTRVSSTFFL